VLKNLKMRGQKNKRLMLICSLLYTYFFRHLKESMFV
jgi:hypothetical protein